MAPPNCHSSARQTLRRPRGYVTIRPWIQSKVCIEKKTLFVCIFLMYSLSYLDVHFFSKSPLLLSFWWWKLITQIKSSLVQKWEEYSWEKRAFFRPYWREQSHCQKMSVKSDNFNMFLFQLPGITSVINDPCTQSHPVPEIKHINTFFFCAPKDLVDIDRLTDSDTRRSTYPA